MESLEEGTGDVDSGNSTSHSPEDSFRYNKRKSWLNLAWTKEFFYTQLGIEIKIKIIRPCWSILKSPLLSRNFYKKDKTEQGIVEQLLKQINIHLYRSLFCILSCLEDSPLQIFSDINSIETTRSEDMCLKSPLCSKPILDKW